MRTLLLIVGLLAIAAGVIWAGQGLGYITWTPPGMHPSFMINDRHWVYYGGAVAVFGLLLVWYSRRN